MEPKIGMDLFWMSSMVLQNKKNPFCLETATDHAQWLILRQVFFLWTNWVMGMKARHRDFISNSPAVTQRSLPFVGQLWQQWNCFLMGSWQLLMNSDLQPLDYCNKNTCHPLCWQTRVQRSQLRVEHTAKLMWLLPYCSQLRDRDRHTSPVHLPTS